MASNRTLILRLWLIVIYLVIHCSSLPKNETIERLSNEFEFVSKEYSLRLTEYQSDWTSSLSFATDRWRSVATRESRVSSEHTFRAIAAQNCSELFRTVQIACQWRRPSAHCDHRLTRSNESIVISYIYCRLFVWFWVGFDRLRFKPFSRLHLFRC